MRELCKKRVVRPPPLGRSARRHAAPSAPSRFPVKVLDRVRQKPERAPATPARYPTTKIPVPPLGFIYVYKIHTIIICYSINISSLPAHRYKQYMKKLQWERKLDGVPPNMRRGVRRGVEYPLNSCFTTNGGNGRGVDEDAESFQRWCSSNLGVHRMRGAGKLSKAAAVSFAPSTTLSQQTRPGARVGDIFKITGRNRRQRCNNIYPSSFGAMDLIRTL